MSSVDYSKLTRDAALTLEKAGAPLTEDQITLLAGSLAVYVEAVLPTNPTSAPDVAALSDEAIERALDTPMTLDHTLRQLIRGDTMAVGTSKVHVVRTLLNALKAAQQETAHAKA